MTGAAANGHIPEVAREGAQTARHGMELASTPEVAGRVKVFGELIDHHASEEEDTMFEMARELFSAKELSAFADFLPSPAVEPAITD